MDSFDSEMVLLDEALADSILDFIEPRRGIPEDVAECLRKSTDESFRCQILGMRIHPQAVPLLRDALRFRYLEGLIHAGSNVGIELAQSLGERHSQSLLNSFHSSGLSKENHTSRFGQILNATTLQNPLHMVYLDPPAQDASKVRFLVAKNLMHVTVASISSRIVVSDEKEYPPWHRVYCALNSIEEDSFHGTGRIVLTLNASKMVEFDVLPSDVCAAIENAFAGIICVHAPLRVGQIDIYVPLPNDCREDMKRPFLAACLGQNIPAVHVAGIRGVSEMALQVSDDASQEVYVSLLGGSFREIMNHPLTDSRRTTCNGLSDIKNVLGIEALRCYLVEELFLCVVPGVNMCHLSLLCDHMTFTGTIRSVSRYSMRAVKGSVLAKSTFEESMDHLVNGGIFGSSETVCAVSSSLVCGKRVQTGTGFADILVDVSAIMESQ